MHKNIRRSIVIAAGVTGAWALGGTHVRHVRHIRHVRPVVDGVGGSATGLAYGVTGDIRPFADGVTGEVAPFVTGAAGQATPFARHVTGMAESAAGPTLANAVTGVRGVADSVTPSYLPHAAQGHAPQGPHAPQDDGYGLHGSPYSV